MNNLRYWFRYYFIRKKAPLSWIWWHNILRRDFDSVGMYPVSIAESGFPDCAISLNRGAPEDNHIEIVVYDASDKIVETIRIPLSYNSMNRVIEGFDKAFALSRKSIKEHNASLAKENE